MPTNLKLDYLEFPASDLSAIKAFYGAAFGWTFVDYGPDYVAFNDGKMDGGFFRSDRKSHTDNGSALVIIYAEDLEATERTVVASGGVISTEIFSFPGGRRFHFTDPHGNELAVWSDR